MSELVLNEPLLQFMPDYPTKAALDQAITFALSQVMPLDRFHPGDAKAYGASEDTVKLRSLIYKGERRDVFRRAFKVQASCLRRSWAPGQICRQAAQHTR